MLLNEHVPLAAMQQGSPYPGHLEGKSAVKFVL